MFRYLLLVSFLVLTARSYAADCTITFDISEFRIFNTQKEADAFCKKFGNQSKNCYTRYYDHEIQAFFLLQGSTLGRGGNDRTARKDAYDKLLRFIEDKNLHIHDELTSSFKFIGC